MRSPLSSASSPLAGGLLLAVALLALAIASTASSLEASILMVAIVSLFELLVSGRGRTPFWAVVSSGGGATMPFGLLDADEVGRCRPFSTLDCMEFCLARDEAGRTEAMEGAGEARATTFGSKLGCIGEGAIAGESAATAAVAVLLQSKELAKTNTAKL